MHRTAVTTATAELDDKLQRALQEVHQLKHERNDLQIKLRHLQTQFRRLTADMKSTMLPDITVVESPTTPRTTNTNKRTTSISKAASHSDPQNTKNRPVVLSKPKVNSPARHAAETHGLHLVKKRDDGNGKANPPSLPSLLPGAEELLPSIPASSGRSGKGVAGPRPVSSAEYPFRATTSSTPAMHSPNVNHVVAELGATQLALQCCTAELEQMKKENHELRGSLENATKSLSSKGGANEDVVDAIKTKHNMEINRLNGENVVLQEQLKLVRAEVERLQQANQQSWQSSQQHLAALSTQLQTAGTAQLQMDNQYKQAIQQLTFERDHLIRQKTELEERLQQEVKRASEAESKASAATSSAREKFQEDLQLLVNSSLPPTVESRSPEHFALERKVQQLEIELRSHKTDRQRLSEEAQQLHQNLADAKRSVLQLTQEKYALQLQADRTSQLEQDIRQKNAELAEMEQQVLQTASSIQSCQRETADAVRREVGEQIADLQMQVEEAHRARRDKEREVLECRQLVAEAKRATALVQADADMFKAHIEKLEKQYASRSELERAALVGEVTEKCTMAQYAARGGMSEEEMHRVLAIAALRKRTNFSDRDTELVSDPGMKGPLSKEANNALDLFDSLGWDEQWEAKQLREALATAALDLELADQHSNQERSQAEQLRQQLKQMTAERDALLEENVEMRRRLSHVQTVFAKQQLQAYRKTLEQIKDNGISQNGQPSGSGQINFCIRAVDLEDVALPVLQLPDRQSPTALFFTLDGLEMYETMVSPTFFSLQECPTDVLFLYDGLAPDELTIAHIQRTRFVLQLHHVTEDGSEVVAQAEMLGPQLLHAREMALEESLALVDGDGVLIGHVLIEFSCYRLMLPVTLGLPMIEHSSSSKSVASSGMPNTENGLILSAMEVKSALVALRSVTGIRVQVFRLEMNDQMNGQQGEGFTVSRLEPYVFYTTSSPFPTVSAIRDTVVKPSPASASRLMTHPGEDITFEQEPIEHRVAVDKDLIHFLCYSNIVFVVFDSNSEDIEKNLGTLEVPLRPLLESPQAVIRQSHAINSSATLSVGLSWCTV